MTTNKLALVFILFFLWILTSCGSNTQVAGIGGTGITATGPITEFGSIFVNGIEFETDTTDSIIVDHIPFDDQSGLALGMVVTVTGTVNDDGLTGTADTIFYDDDIEGPVSGLIRNGTALSFSILGQVVTADAIETIFDDTTIDTLVDGDFVEVSGFVDSSVSPAEIRATRIEKKGDSSNTDEVDIEGTVSDFISISSFMVLGQSIDASNATFSPESLINDISDGVRVEIQGTYDGNMVTATFVEINDGTDFDVDEGDEISIEGIVSDFQGINSFVVLGQEVDASNAEFDPLSLKDSIANGVRVEAEGIIENGILIADEIEAE